jgi:hypothetical protein
MKKIICFILSAVFLAGMIGCKNDGGSLLPLLGLAGLGGGDNPSGATDPAAMKYMEYMYQNDNGQRLNDQAMSGMPDTDEFKAGLNEMMSTPFIENLGISNENTESTNWWEHLNINADDVAGYLSSDEGKKALQDYISSDSGIKGNIVSGISISGPRKSTGDPVVDGLVNGIKLLNNMDAIMTNIACAGIWIFRQFNAINEKLDAIQNSIEAGFEQTMFKLDEIEAWLKEQDLVEARNTVNAKIKSFANLEGYDDVYRRSVIKEYFTVEHQVLFEQAYNSAKEITAYMNARPVSVDYKRVPGSMLYSHMVFMRQMSELRLAYAPVFYSHHDLLRFRANWAESDLVWVKEIKDAFLSDAECLTDGAYFSQVCLLLASWEIELRAHIALVNENDVLNLQLENASNIRNDEAFGTFGDLNDIANSGSCGEPLSSDNGTLLTRMFSNGASLESMFDTGRSGGMASGKYFRIVHKGNNLLSDLGLVPVMRQLLLPTNQIAPGKGQFFIDPAMGRFVLPRPDYWCKMETVGSMTEPELRDYRKPVLEITSGELAAVTGKNGFGNCIELNGNGESIWDLYSFGKSEVVNQGTISVWWNPDGALDYYFKIFIGGPNSYIEIKNNYSRIVINGEEKDKKDDLALDRQWNHIYVVWDRAQSLDANLKTVRVFINGADGGSCYDVFAPGVFSCRAESHMGVFGSNNKVDNIKIWKHVVSESPEWEYKHGLGREKALHAVYGTDSNPEYDYRPKLAGSGNGVGYYYMP